MEKKNFWIVKKKKAKVPITISPTLEDAKTDRVLVMKKQRKMGGRPRIEQFEIKKVSEKNIDKKSKQYKEMLEYYKM